MRNLTVSEGNEFESVNICLHRRWKAAEQPFHVSLSTEIGEYAAIVVEVLLDAQKCLWMSQE